MSIKLPCCIKLAFHIILWGRRTVRQPSGLALACSHSLLNFANAVVVECFTGRAILNRNKFAWDRANELLQWARRSTCGAKRIRELFNELAKYEILTWSYRPRTPCKVRRLRETWGSHSIAAEYSNMAKQPSRTTWPWGWWHYNPSKRTQLMSSTDENSFHVGNVRAWGGQTVRRVQLCLVSSW